MARVNRMHDPASLEAIIQKHADRVRTPFNRCHRASIELADELLRKGYPARVIRCSDLLTYAPRAHRKWIELGSQMYWTHYVVRVDDTVFDLTRRQFFPEAPNPFIQPITAFEAEWEEVEIDWAWHRDNGLLPSEEDDGDRMPSEPKEHSMTDEDEARPFPETEVVYHSTLRANRESILQHGLALRFSETSELVDDPEIEAGAIFFSTKRLFENPERFDTWEVAVSDLPDLIPDDTTEPSDEEDTWWMVYRSVPPQVLRLAEPTCDPTSGTPSP